MREGEQERDERKATIPCIRQWFIELSKFIKSRIVKWKMRYIRNIVSL